MLKIKFKILILFITSVFPSSIRIILMNILGFNVDSKAKLKIFSIIIAKNINIKAYAKIDSFVVIAGLDSLIMNENSAIQRFTYISGNHLFKLNKRGMVGSRCVISAGAGDIEIGEYSALAPRSSIYTHGTFLPVTLGYPTTNKAVKIGDYCWIMQNSSIGPGVSIESNSIILPGSSIVKNVPGNLVVYDTPTQRKSFPIYFFRKKPDDTELINLIKEITVNYLTTLKSKNIKLDFTTENEAINIKYMKNKYYKILFSKITPQSLAYDEKIVYIYFYFEIDLEIMKSRNYICYDFKKIIKSYTKLPEFLKEFDDFAFNNYGLKFIDADYF